MSYLYVKWNSLRRGLLAGGLVIKACHPSAWPLPVRRDRIDDDLVLVPSAAPAEVGDLLPEICAFTGLHADVGEIHEEPLTDNPVCELFSLLRLPGVSIFFGLSILPIAAPEQRPFYIGVLRLRTKISNSEYSDLFEGRP